MTKKNTSIYRKNRRKNRFNCDGILVLESVQFGYVDPDTGEDIDLPEQDLLIAWPAGMPRG